MTDEFYAPEYRRRRQVSMLVVGAGAAVMFAAAVWLWIGLRGLDERETRLAARLDALAQREEALGAQAEAHASALATLTGAQGGIAQRLDALYGARRSGLLATEAEYLVRLAAQRLALAHDAAGSATLLLAADAALREIRDADVLAARAALASDGARLRAVAAVDVEAVYLRLAALPAQVERIAAVPVNSPPRDRAESTAVTAEDGRSVWQRFSDTLRTLVNVRRVDAPLEPLVTRGEKQFAVQNFRLLVDQAQLALLQRQGGIYRHSLTQAGEWLDRLAAGDPVVRNAVRRELSSLAALAPETSLPELDASLAATRALVVRLVPETGDAR